MRRTHLAITYTSLWILACGPAVTAPSAKIKPQQNDPRPASTDISEVGTPISDLARSPDPATASEIDRPQQGSMPNIPGPFFSNPGSVNLAATSPGTATFTLAPVVDFQGGVGPSTLGTGGWQSIVVGGSTFNESMAESMAGVLPDDTGVDYLLLVAYTEEVDPSTGAMIGTVMYAVVLASDFAPGATVTLDGIDRLAIFARGDIDLPDPELAAAALSGTITFSAGGLAIGDQITATLNGDFGEFTWNPTPPPPPPGGTLSAGSYSLAYDPTPYVYCDGSLAGQESLFSSVTLSTVGFADGPVTVTAGSAAGTFEISGSPITSGYATSSLLLESMPDAPPGVVAGVTYASGTISGPANTQLYGTYLAIDGNAATSAGVLGWSGAGFGTAYQDGFCSVDFGVELTP